MRKAFYAAMAAAAAAAISPSAHAAISIACPGSSGSAACQFDESAASGIFGSTVFGDFDDTFLLTLTGTYRLSITITNTLEVNGPISFSVRKLLNSTPASLGNLALGAVANDFIVGPGVYAMHFTGSATARASYSGTIDISPVPEPASWAMMVAGIAAIGTALRRRSSSVAFS